VKLLYNFYYLHNLYYKNVAYIYDYFLMEFLMILIAATKSKNPNKSYTEKNCLRKASIVT